MPHIIVKLYTGRSEQQKTQLTKKIVKNIVEIAGCKEADVSVAIEEIEPGDWAETVYRPDILNGPGTLYQKPGYDPFEVKTTRAGQMKRLKQHIRETAASAEKEHIMPGAFNAMSWLDLEIENNPDVFDHLFDTAWDKLSGAEREERVKTIRSVL